MDTNRKLIEAEFTKRHTLSQEQLKQLVENKMKRALQYYNARQKVRDMQREVA